ncbi:hypothetical protein ACLB2K_038845 [Fragaria x ananassa]
MAPLGLNIVPPVRVRRDRVIGVASNIGKVVGWWNTVKNCFKKRSEEEEEITIEMAGDECRDDKGNVLRRQSFRSMMKDAAEA